MAYYPALKTRCDYCSNPVAYRYRYHSHLSARSSRGGRVIAEVAGCADHKHCVDFARERHPQQVVNEKPRGAK